MSISHVGRIFAGVPSRQKVSLDDWLAGMAENLSILDRLPTLAEVAETAAFVASDRASAITGAIVNVTAGASVD